MRLLNFKQSFLVINVILPVVIGGLIYILFRVDTLWVFTWLRYAGLYETVMTLRETTYATSSDIPAHLLYSLPDGLWVYSFSVTMQLIWFRQSNWVAKILKLLPLILGLLGEIGQISSLIIGTYDNVDVVYVVVSWLASLLAIRFYQRHLLLNSEPCSKNLAE